MIVWLKTTFTQAIILALACLSCCDIAAAQDAAPAATPPANLAAPVRPPAPPNVSDPFRPYRVRVHVSLPDELATTPAAAQSITSELLELLQARYRQCWDVSIDHAPGNGASQAELRSLTEETAEGRWLEKDLDKVILLAGDQHGSVLQFTAREWDAPTRTLSAITKRDSFDERDHVAVAANLISAVFRPLVKLETLNGKTGEFQIRAGELPPRSAEQALVSPGEYLVPYLRHLDREQQVRRVQPLPWSYLRATNLDRARVSVEVVSAFPAPIPAARRRMEVVALRVRPQLTETRMHVFPRRDVQSPLAGVRCLVFDDGPPTGTAPVPSLTLVTARDGTVSLPADPAHPLRYLDIRSGAALLARVPVIPGLVEELSLDVPDDRSRLLVEGETDLLKGELIEIVATREVIMGRARAAAEAARWAEFDRFLADLAKLPTVEQYNVEIDALQIQGVYQAQQARDRTAEARIKKLCDGVREAAAKHLDPFRISEFRQEMAALRRGK